MRPAEDSIVKFLSQSNYYMLQVTRRRCNLALFATAEVAEVDRGYALDLNENLTFDLFFEDNA